MRNKRLVYYFLVLFYCALVQYAQFINGDAIKTDSRSYNAQFIIGTFWFCNPFAIGKVCDWTTGKLITQDMFNSVDNISEAMSVRTCFVRSCKEMLDLVESYLGKRFSAITECPAVILSKYELSDFFMYWYTFLAIPCQVSVTRSDVLVPFGLLTTRFKSGSDVPDYDKSIVVNRTEEGMIMVSRKHDTKRTLAKILKLLGRESETGNRKISLFSVLGPYFADILKNDLGKDAKYFATELYPMCVQKMKTQNPSVFALLQANFERHEYGKDCKRNRLRDAIQKNVYKKY